MDDTGALAAAPPVRRRSTAPAVPADVGDLLGSFSAAVTELADLPSASRDVLIDGLRACCARMAAHLHDERLSADPERAQVLAYDALSAVGLLAHRLGRGTQPAARRTTSAPNSPAEPTVRHGAGDTAEAVPATDADADGSDTDPLPSPVLPARTGSARSDGPDPMGQDAGLPPQEDGPAPRAASTAGQPAAPPKPTYPPLPVDHTERLRGALAERFESLYKDPDAKPWLDAPIPQLRPKGWAGVAEPTTIQEIWCAAHMALLHLPAEQMDRWRDDLWQTARSAAEDDIRFTSEWSTARAPGDPSVIIPALPGHCTEERLAVRPDTEGELPASLPPALAAAARAGEPDPRHERWRVWAVRAGQILRLTALDSALVLCWKGKVAGPVDQDYFTTLLEERLRRLMTDGTFRAEYDLDALVGSVLRPTVAALDSWWWQWRIAPWADLAGSAPRAGYEFFPHQNMKFIDRDQVSRFTVGENFPGPAQPSAPLVQWVLHALVRPTGSQEKGLGVVVVQQPSLSGRTR
ncbi:hypothetical protein [Streptomyces sp. HUAS TT20]|uniref:hypothetical protein n=1 Tax=Streptomyces sp. HUAS TT20 TaxID=3447509 RepID=UPI0021DAE96C|nr:hypothetical protein [Streptomyces sp. HUAS 15-9]UXY31143.1 hypothetical protein N8I87_34390 [Streptomyces sp. HUAS 15-9]